MLSEEFVHAYFLGVDYVHEWFCVFRETSRENNDFIELCHFLKKVFNSRSYQNVDFAGRTLNFYRQHYIWRVNCFK